jgi:hypothetical protein
LRRNREIREYRHGSLRELAVVALVRAWTNREGNREIRASARLSGPTDREFAGRDNRE